MRVLITGPANIIKDSVVKLAVEEARSPFRFHVLSFSDFDSDGKGYNPRFLAETRKRLAEEIQLKLLEKKSGDIIINGYCLAKTDAGLSPVITEETALLMKPDIIVCIQTDPLALSGKVKNQNEFEKLLFMESMASLHLSIRTGAAFETIRTGPDGARTGAENLRNLLNRIVLEI